MTPNREMAAQGETVRHRLGQLQGGGERMGRIRHRASELSRRGFPSHICTFGLPGNHWAQQRHSCVIALLRSSHTHVRRGHISVQPPAITQLHQLSQTLETQGQGSLQWFLGQNHHLRTSCQHLRRRQMTIYLSSTNSSSEQEGRLDPRPPVTASP